VNKYNHNNARNNDDDDDDIEILEDYCKVRNRNSFQLIFHIN
jgi:hypothetical protein